MANLGHASSIANGRREPAGLGDIGVVWGFRRQIVAACLHRNAVAFAQPTAQIDPLAPLAAEGEIRPIGRARAFHDPVADRATCG